MISSPQSRGVLKQCGRGRNLSWSQTGVSGIYKMLLLSSFLDLRIGGHFCPVLEICYCWCISVAAKILAVSFWRWTRACLNSDYRTALTRFRSVLTDKLKLVSVLFLMMMEWFWEQWRKPCNFSKITEKGGKQSWVFAVYI